MATRLDAIQQRACETGHALRFPQRRAAMDILQRVQRSDFGQLAHLILAQLGNAAGEVVDAGEGALAQDGLGGFFTESAHVAEAQAHGGFCEIRSYRA